jgi:hypothetical protein
MAMLFDLSILLVILYAVSAWFPGLVQSDYKKTIDRYNAVVKVHDARQTYQDAKGSKAKATALKDLQTKVKDANKLGGPADASHVTVDTTASQDQKIADALTKHVRTTQFITSGVALVLSMLYLVPAALPNGTTFGMRRRKLRIVRVDGSRATAGQIILRFIVPVMFGVTAGVFGVLPGLIALIMVGFSFFDRNRQGLHDKLAKTLVVSA